jgi:hypothetical protein
MPAIAAGPQGAPTAPDKSALAQGAYACPACGGDAHWNPAKRTLVCASCGTALPPPAHAGQQFKFSQRPVADGIRDAPTDAAKDTRLAVMCGSCHAVSHFDAGTAADRCSFCGSTAIVPYDVLGDRERPQCVLPFLLGESEARDAASAWYRAQWLAPRKLKKAAHIDTVRGVYFPFWNFNADANAHWTSTKGRSGDVTMHFDGLLVCAADNAQDALLSGVEPFPANDLRAYDAHYVAGWTVGRYQRDLARSRNLAHERMNAKMLDQARKDMHGEKDVGTISITTAQYAAETYAQALLPVWLLSYTYLGRPYALVINGATGKAEGNSPKSWIKMALIGVLFAWGALFYMDGETAIKLPFWILEGLWWLVKWPFTRGT